jgi:hypothetical protein
VKRTINSFDATDADTVDASARRMTFERKR